MRIVVRKKGKLDGDTFSYQPWTQSERLPEFLPLSLDSFQLKLLWYFNQRDLNTQYNLKIILVVKKFQE